MQVVQADGGLVAAAINGATLALVDAGVPLDDMACACSAGVVEGEPILDLCYPEEASNSPVVPVVIHPTSGKVVSLSLNARMPIEFLERVVELASIGCNQVHELMCDYLRQHVAEELKRRDE